MTTTTDQHQTTGDFTAEPVQTGTSTPPDPGASLDKVRDILFGNQMRELDRRFARVEDRLTSEASDLKEDLRRRLATLEQFVRTETEVLLERIRGEHEERTAAVAGVARDLQTASAGIDRRLAAVDDQLARAQRELRQQILDVHQQLADRIQERADAILARLARETDDLRAAKADRAALAELFTDLAMRLAHEPAGGSAQE